MTTRARWICPTVASVSAVGLASASRSACVVNTFSLMTSAPSNDRRSLKTGHTDDLYFDLEANLQISDVTHRV